MRNFFLFFAFMALLVPICLSQQPKIEYFVNDYAKLLTYEEIAEIEPIFKKIYDSGKAEYAIVIIDTLGGEDIEGYSYRLSEGNLGDKEKNNGLLLLIAVNDRQYRFEVGRGLEPELPDIIMGRIGRYYLEPNFKNGDYAQGIMEASIQIQDILLNNATLSEKESQTEIGTNLKTIVLIIIILFIIRIIIIIATANATTRSDGDYFTAAWLLSSMMKGGKGGFGGSGGGFGGFGGGSMGGGGSSGGW